MFVTPRTTSWSCSAISKVSLGVVAFSDNVLGTGVRSIWRHVHVQLCLVWWLCLKVFNFSVRVSSGDTQRQSDEANEMFFDFIYVTTLHQAHAQTEVTWSFFGETLQNTHQKPRPCTSINLWSPHCICLSSGVPCRRHNTWPQFAFPPTCVFMCRMDLHIYWEYREREVRKSSQWCFSPPDF